MFTCVKQPWFEKEWIGRELNKNTIKDLMVLVKKYEMDPCEENGEYPTIAIDGPIFKKPIGISKFTKEKTDKRFFMKVTDTL